MAAHTSRRLMLILTTLILLTQQVLCQDSASSKRFLSEQDSSVFESREQEQSLDEPASSNTADTPLMGARQSEDVEVLAKEVLEMWERVYSGIEAGMATTQASSAESMGRLPQNPRPPHLHDCEALAEDQRILDARGVNGSLPRWSFFGSSTVLSLQKQLEQGGTETPWQEEQRIELKGEEYLLAPHEKEDQILGLEPGPGVMGPLPPWVTGADEDNLVLTRRVQRDLWVHQHPRDCSAPGLKFLVANITHEIRRKSNYTVHLGVGAHFMAAAGLFGEAVKGGRILVFESFVRADHDDCQGRLRGRWECYFAAETTELCRGRALEALRTNWTVAERNEQIPVSVHWQHEHSSYPFWDRAPGNWGTPWENIHPSVVVDGQLVRHTRDDSHRWFRAQALRYLTRYTSPRLCHLVNRARHAAFGKEAAVVVAEGLLASGHTKVLENAVASDSPLEAFWRRVPEGLFHGTSHIISMHVRQGDKIREMVIHPCSHHMKLAAQVRARFPTANRVWLSTEMQTVVDESSTYKGWKFYYTDSRRQGQVGVKNGNYERDFGIGHSTDNAIINTLIAASCDFFVGTMGSTSSLIIDDLRRTSGKEARGLLSVNKDRAWMSQEERSRMKLYMR